MTNIVLEHDGHQSEHRKEEIVAWPKIKPAEKKDPMFSPYNEDLCNVSILTAEEDGIYTSQFLNISERSQIQELKADQHQRILPCSVKTCDFVFKKVTYFLK